MATSFITTVIDGLKETYKTRLNRLNISFINPQVTITDTGTSIIPEIPSIPIASKDEAGIVKIGDGINMNDDGMISVQIPEYHPVSLTTEQTEQVETMISTTSQEIFSQVNLLIDNLSQGMNTDISSINAELSSLKERIALLENTNQSSEG